MGVHTIPYTDAEAVAAVQAENPTFPLSKVIWKDASEQALSDTNRTTTLNWTALDLTAYTSANAKFAILTLMIKVDSYTSGIVYMATRKNGTTPTYTSTMWATTEAITANFTKSLIIQGLDAGQVLEHTLVISATAQADFYIDVLGYIE